MKKPFAFVLTVCVLSALFSGCTKETYEIYTNFPEGEYTVTANNFVLRDGLSPLAGREDEKFTPPAGLTVKTNDNFYAMSANAALVVYADFSSAQTLEKYNALCADITRTLGELDNSLSATVSTSSVSKFNATDAGETVEIDYHAYTLLNLSKTIYERTEGYYNPAVYHSVKAYGFIGESRPSSADELPSEALTEKFVALSDKFAEVQLYAENGAYYAVKPDFTVTEKGVNYTLGMDLGGIGKGYAADVVGELIRSYGFTYGYFNFASSSISVMRSAKSGIYTMGLKNPRGGGDYIRFKVMDEPVSTSGDYFLNYTLEGQTFCSVINPHTGKPVREGVITATVVGVSAAENDAYTTAIMAMGKERALQFVNRALTDRKVVFVCGNGG